MVASDPHEHWQRVQQVFAEAVGLEPAQRTDRLTRLDDRLRVEVQALLERYDRGERIDWPPADEPSQSGEHLIGGRYSVLEELGRGGMGVVFRADDRALQKPVALKFLPAHLHASPEARRRFLVEARAAAAVDHPNVCSVFDVGEAEDGRPFIAMAYYAGQTLEARLAQGPLAVGEAVEVGRQVARGLAAAHEQGIVHRDLKPSNVLVTEAGVVKLLDFGIAKVAGAALTREGLALGTPGYAAPEQEHGKGDHRVDVWALGVVLYEMLAGRRAFEGEYEAGLLYAVVHEEPTPLREVAPEVPSAVASVVARCLEKDPAQRYGSAAEVEAALAQALEPAGAPRRRWRLVLVVAAGLALAALTLALLVPSLRATAEDWLGRGGTEAQLFAVLPLAGEDAALADGLTQTLTGLLARMAPYAEDSLVVVPAAEVRGVTDARSAAERLGVQRALSGTVRQEAGLVRLALALTDAQRQRPIATRAIEVRAERMADLQRELVEHVAAMLGITLTRADRERLTLGGTTSSRAYDFYLKGRAALGRYYEAGQLDVALQFFQWAIEEDSAYALAHADLCAAYWFKYEATWETALVARAEQSCERAIRLDERLPEAHITLGIVRAGRGQPEEAVKELTLALALDSTNAAAHSHLASAYAALGRRPAAEIHYRRAIALQPTRWEHLNALGIFYLDQGRYEEAAERFQQSLRRSPQETWPRINLGAALLHLGRVAEAHAAFEHVLEAAPSIAAYVGIGALYYEEGRYADEARMYERALALDSTDYRVWGNLGGAYQRSGAPPEVARRAFERAALLAAEALEVNPSDPAVLIHRGTYLLNLGRARKARDALERALQSGLQDVDLAYRAGVLFERLGEREEAITWIRQALQEGYPPAYAETDPDLQALWQDPRWARLAGEKE